MAQHRKAKLPGRPPGGNNEPVRQQLLDAAHSLFLSYEFKAVSIRRIADQAGVNPAMVNYYFGSKQGLYLAMVEQMLAVLEKSQLAMQGRGGNSVTDFISAYMEFLGNNPWWPIFVVREVLFGKEEFRSEIARRFNQSIAQNLLHSINKEVDSGHFRDSLEPRFAAWSLIGMMVFPFISGPLAQHILKFKMDDKNRQALARHTSELFLQGVLNQGDRQ